MDIGSSVAIFLVLSLILLALFCLLTKYFHHKLTQNIQEAAEIYSMVDEIGVNEQQSQNCDGNYEKFKELQMQKILRAESKKKPGYEEIQMAQMIMKTPLKSNNDDLYTPNILKMRLNNEVIPRIMETDRSMSSLKQFKPEKLVTTNRTGRSNNEENDSKRSMDKVAAQPDDENTSYHTFINKLVCYDSQGITVVQVNVISIKKVGEGVFKENKKVKTEVTMSHEGNFDDQLQIFGFQKGVYGCYKYLTKVEINNMKFNEDYAIKTLKTCQVKQSMEIQEYLRIKMELQSSL